MFGMVRKFLIWLGLIKPASWFRVDWGMPERHQALRTLFPHLRGTFRVPTDEVPRPHRRLMPRYKGRPSFRYKRDDSLTKAIKRTPVWLGYGW